MAKESLAWLASADFKSVAAELKRIRRGPRRYRLNRLLYLQKRLEKLEQKYIDKARNG